MPGRTGNRAAGDRLLALVAFVMVALYTANAVGTLVPSLADPVARFTNVGGKAQEGGIEILEAILWGFASVAFAWAALRAWRGSAGVRRLSGRVLWCSFFAGLAFLALGEETSWGNAYGLYEAPESVAAVNAQKEFNLHNLNATEILQLDPEGPLGPLLRNISQVINPIFYAFFLAAWVLIPWLLRTDRLRGKLWNGYPAPSVGVSRFFAINLLAWIVVDRLYEVGELFEVSISITVALVGWEALGAGRLRALLRVAGAEERPHEDPAEDLDDFVEGAAAREPDRRPFETSA